MTRRHSFGLAGTGIGTAALATLVAQDAQASEGLPGLPHFPPTAKRVIYLFQHGAPSQLDLFDYKPKLQVLRGTDLPDSVRQGQRLTGMTAYQTKFPTAPSIFKFAQCGQSGTWLSEILPHTGQVADRLCLIKALQTDAINHDPAVTFFETGAQIAGRPSMGAWIAYGLGSESEELPAFVVMVSQGVGNTQALAERQWASGFLPSRFQGVKFRSGADPVLYLSNPPGLTTERRRIFLDALGELNKTSVDEFGDPEINARISQYEMAFRMQQSVPELTDLSKEPAHTFELYGDDARKPGTFAANCLLARRLAERGVRFIQLYHRDWDHHAELPGNLPKRCKDVDQASAGLILDLQQRGMLDDTLVIWGGEFGRTVYCQGRLTATDYGRDHHGRCFTMWLSGGGTKPGITLGETDDYGYNINKDPVHVHDLQATILRCLGIDHLRLTYKFQGREFRLTDVEGKVVKGLLAV